LVISAKSVPSDGWAHGAELVPYGRGEAVGKGRASPSHHARAMAHRAARPVVLPAKPATTPSAARGSWTLASPSRARIPDHDLLRNISVASAASDSTSALSLETFLAGARGSLPHCHASYPADQRVNLSRSIRRQQFFSLPLGVFTDWRPCSWMVAFFIGVLSAV